MKFFAKKMVVIHYKKSESNQFRYETSVLILVEDLIAKLAESNFFLKTDCLAATDLTSKQYEDRN